MSSGTAKKGWNKKYQMMVKNSQRESQATIENIEDLLGWASNNLAVHIGSNEWTNDFNLLNSTETISKEVSEISPSTKL